MLAVSIEHITRSPDVRGGKPRIVDTRMAVEDVAMLHLKLGYGLVEIAGQYGLSVASVYAAMAYYFDHREEIDLRTVQEDAWVETFRQNHPSCLEEKLRKLRGERSDSFSSR
jgi:uncharacterized protein (DUF433 family)